MRPPTELILVRHGETEWNRELRFQGHVDIALNDIGHEQARRLALRLGEAKPQRLISSDLRRARQTAEEVARETKLSVLTFAALRGQHFGMVDGMAPKEIERLHPVAWKQWLEFRQDHAMPGGESRRAFHARVLEALGRIVSAHAGQRIALVTHGDVLDMVWRTANGSSLDGMRDCQIPNAGFNRVRIVDPTAPAQIEVLDWADTQHLIGLPAQPVYDQRRHFQSSDAQ